MMHFESGNPKPEKTVIPVQPVSAECGQAGRVHCANRPRRSHLAGTNRAAAIDRHPGRPARGCLLCINLEALAMYYRMLFHII